MSARRVFSRAFPVLIGGATMASVIASCADSEAPAAAIFDAGPVPDSAVTIPPPDTGVPILPCKAGGWCVVALPPDPVSLNGIWGSSADDVWIVGSPDLTLHWDGKALASGQTHSKQSLFGIWGSGKSDVWTFSSGAAMWHSNGFVDGGPDWTAYDAGAAHPAWSGPVFGMWGKAPNDVWTVGPFSLSDSLPSVWRCDGWRNGAPQWRSELTGTSRDQAEPFSFNAIWGDSDGEVWVVGIGGKTRMAKEADGGASWSAVNSETTNDLYAVWGSGKGEVWAAGGGGTMRHFVRGTNGTYAVTSVDTPTTATINALTGFAPDDVWGVGTAGTLIHWDGKVWTQVDVTIPKQADADLFAVWGSSATDLWVAGRNTLLYKGMSKLPEKSK